MKKRNNKKGFTLAELLIVVAIIAVLTAIAIPVFSGQLEKAKESADMANVRSAYAEAVAKNLTDNQAYPADYNGASLNYVSKLSWSGGASGLTVTYAAVKNTPLSLSAAAADS